MRTSIVFLRVFVTLLVSLCSACGSSATSPSEMDTQSGSGILVQNVSVRASLERSATAPSAVSYTYCYTMGANSPDVENMILRRVDYVTVGPTGEVYNTSADPFLVGQTVWYRGGCFFTYRDPNITRPVATTYRLQFQYSPAAGGKPFAQTVTGNISSTVPPPPYITSVTLTDDIADGQRVLRRPTPITFTAHVEGGAPPFLYQWRLNGFMLRDWDPNPVLFWDGATLAGRPVGSIGYTLAVSVRRSIWPEPEGGASTSFVLVF